MIRYRVPQPAPEPPTRVVPGKPIAWLVWQTGSELAGGVVVQAQTWIDARYEGARLLGCRPGTAAVWGPAEVLDPVGGVA